MDGNFLPPGLPIYEVIGVGFGPSNIALAIALALWLVAVWRYRQEKLAISS